MPVGTNATVKALDPDDLDEVGASIILANTYHLYLRPGHERIERLGGLHRFMGWDRPILTDSRRLPGRLARRPAASSTTTGSRSAATSTARSTGSRRSTRSRVQEALGSDVAVAFDQPVPPGRRRGPLVAEATERTHRWAERSLAAHRRSDQALFGIVQGGLEPDLRAESARFIAAPPVRRDLHRRAGRRRDGRPSATRRSTSSWPLLDGDPRVRYLMGLGSPADMLEAVHRGVDLFDSVLPARVARNGQVWVPGGRLNLRNQRFLDDPAPIQEDCPCLACRRFSRAYLAHLFRARRAPRLPSRDLSQPHLHPRLHGQDPRRDSGRNLPRNAPGAALARRPDERR